MAIDFKSKLAAATGGNYTSERKEYLQGVVRDMVAMLLYYDRKEDDKLEIGDIEEMIKDGEVTIDEVISWFTEEFTTGVGQ